MKAADYFKLTYSDQNTNILSMYLSQMKQTQRSAIARQRDISTRIGRLETQLHRWRRDYKERKSADREYKKGFDALKENYKERKSLREAMRKELNSLYQGGIDVEKLKMTGKGLTLTAQQMRQQLVKVVRKDHEQSPSGRSMAAALETEQRNQFGVGDLTFLTTNLADKKAKVERLTDLQKEEFAS